MSDVSSKLISLYENDHSTPSPETIDALASTLRVPVQFFLLGERPYERGPIFNRSMAATTKRARDRSDWRLTWLRDIVSYLSEFVAFPVPNLPVLDLPTDPVQLSDDEIEDAADQTREFWHLRDGPIANMVLLLENQGVIVARDKLGAQDLEGKSELPPDEKRPYVFIGTDKGSPARWRFDAAHELGHLVLHSHVRPEVLARSENHKLIEKQAHRFAAAFLLPAADFGEELFAANLDALRSLKPRWRTSIGMMITRMGDLGFVNDDTKTKLWISYNRRRWRREEPYDDTMEVEKPRMLARALEILLDHGIQTPDDILTALALHAGDVEALTGLPAGYLGSYSRVGLIDERDNHPEHETTASPAEVIQLFNRGG